MKRQSGIRPLFFLTTLLLALLLSSIATADIIPIPPSKPKPLPPAKGRIVKLPAPRQKGGLGIFDALHAGPTPGSRFPDKKVSLQELSTILWAATGRVYADRVVEDTEKGEALERTYTVYVLGDDGVFVYDRRKNELREVSKKKIKSLKAPKSPGPFQAFAKSSHALAFVLCHQAGDGADDIFYIDWPLVLIQRVYMAAESLGVAATALPLGEETAEVFAYQVAYDVINLQEGERLLTVMPLAKK